MIIPGTDGRKMSKSYNNTINIFADEKVLKKQIMGIVTDSKNLEDPKDPKTCNIFQLYKLVASDAQTQNLISKYQKGGYGYGHAKNELFELIINKYEKIRNKFKILMKDPKHVEIQLQKGAAKAQEVANSVLKKVKSNLGLV